MMVLSFVQVEPLRRAREAGLEQAHLSPDLGLTLRPARLDARGAEVEGSGRLSWAQIDEIAASQHACFEVEVDLSRKIQGFSELTNRVYSLFPTAGAPTMLVSGFAMHRTQGIDPMGDTQAKLRPLLDGARRSIGRLLDTCTGLGYTAIEAAKHAIEVVTIELDPMAQEIARRNPWSSRLFSEPSIRRLLGDACETITTFADRSFDRILHDPPTLSLGGELYSLAFYREAHRVLAPRGRIFHYIGDPRSASGAKVTQGVARRLHAAGFRRIDPRPEAFGLVASK